MNIFVGLLDLADGSTLVTNAFTDESRALGETRFAYKQWVEAQGRNTISGWDVVHTELVGVKGWV